MTRPSGQVEDSFGKGVGEQTSRLVIDKGELTGKLPGKPIHGPGYAKQ